MMKMLKNRWFPSLFSIGAVARALGKKASMEWHLIKHYTLRGMNLVLQGQARALVAHSQRMAGQSCDLTMRVSAYAAAAAAAAAGQSCDLTTRVCFV